jgi:hypothetical protein
MHKFRFLISCTAVLVCGAAVAGDLSQDAAKQYWGQQRQLYEQQEKTRRDMTGYQRPQEHEGLGEHPSTNTYTGVGADKRPGVYEQTSNAPWRDKAQDTTTHGRWYDPDLNGDSRNRRSRGDREDSSPSCDNSGGSAC